MCRVRSDFHRALDLLNFLKVVMPGWLSIYLLLNSLLVQEDFCHNSTQFKCLPLTYKDVILFSSLRHIFPESSPLFETKLFKFHLKLFWKKPAQINIITRFSYSFTLISPINTCACTEGSFGGMANVPVAEGRYVFLLFTVVSVMIYLAAEAIFQEAYLPWFSA